MNPNESAFPQQAIQGNSANIESASAYTGEPGLTIRAYIAAKALQGILANPSNPRAEDISDAWLAETAAKMADALIAELSKTP